MGPNQLEQTLQADIVENNGVMGAIAQSFDSPIAQPVPSKVRGKGVIVTGGTTGIGRALAKRFVSEGANVLIFGRHQKELDDALQDIKPNGAGKVIGLVADQAVNEDVQKVFEKADQELGHLDILVNNAAISAGKVGESGYEDWEYAIRTNLLGLISCTRMAFDRMKSNGGGTIVNIGSMSAEAQDGNSVYVATKAAVRGFTKSFAKEANKAGIRVTNIEPGSVGTDMSEVGPEEQRSKQQEGKMLMAEDIAECVVYTVSQPDRCDVEFVQIRPRIEEE